MVILHFQSLTTTEEINYSNNPVVVQGKSVLFLFMFSMLRVFHFPKIKIFLLILDCPHGSGWPSSSSVILPSLIHSSSAWYNGLSRCQPGCAAQLLHYLIAAPSRLRGIRPFLCVTCAVELALQRCIRSSGKAQVTIAD